MVIELYSLCYFCVYESTRNGYEPSEIYGYKMNSYRHCHKSTSCCLSDEWEDTALISMEAVNHKSSSLCQRQGSYLGFRETAHLPLPRAKCWLRGGVGGQVTQRQYQSLIDYVCDDAGY